MEISDEEKERIRIYWRWCLGTLVLWMVVWVTPSTHNFPMIFGLVNTYFAFLLLPGAMSICSEFFYKRHNYKATLLCLKASVTIISILDLIPNNPYALKFTTDLTAYSYLLIFTDRFPEAEKAGHRLLKLMARRDPDNLKIQTRISFLLSAALAGQGKFEESEKISRATIERLEKQGGSGLAMLGPSMAELAAQLSRMGKFAEAIKIGKKAVSQQENYVAMKAMANVESQDLKLARVRLCMALNNLAVSYSEAGQFQSARETYERTLELKIKTFGEKTRETSIGHSNLASVLLNIGDHQLALSEIEKAQAIVTELNLKTPRIWSEYLSVHGNALRSLGRLEEAEKQLLESEKIRAQSKDPEIHETWFELAKLYRDKKDLVKAEKFFAKTIATMEKRSGSEHPKVGRVLVENAKLLRLQDRLAEAVELERRAAAISEKTEAVLAA